MSPLAVKEGWKLVPVEPTPEMVRALFDEQEWAHVSVKEVGLIRVKLRAALAAAPTFPNTGGPTEEALRAALKECADDLESELNARYPASVRAYPAMDKDFHRDMSSVYAARKLLTEKGEKNP